MLMAVPLTPRAPPATPRQRSETAAELPVAPPAALALNPKPLLALLAINSNIRSQHTPPLPQHHHIEAAALPTLLLTL